MFNLLVIFAVCFAAPAAAEDWMSGINRATSEAYRAKEAQDRHDWERMEDQHRQDAMELERSRAAADANKGIERQLREIDIDLMVNNLNRRY